MRPEGYIWCVGVVMGVLLRLFTAHFPSQDPPYKAPRPRVHSPEMEFKTPSGGEGGPYRTAPRRKRHTSRRKPSIGRPDRRAFFSGALVLFVVAISYILYAWLLCASRTPG